MWKGKNENLQILWKKKPSILFRRKTQEDYVHESGELFFIQLFICCLLYLVSVDLDYFHYVLIPLDAN